jgi:hypothetical protein
MAFALCRQPLFFLLPNVVDIGQHRFQFGNAGKTQRHGFCRTLTAPAPPATPLPVKEIVETAKGFVS